MSDRINGGRPGRHRLALLTWIGVYPLLTLIALALEPVLTSASTPLRTLIMSAIMVPAMVYLVMPTVLRIARVTASGR